MTISKNIEIKQERKTMILITGANGQTGRAIMRSILLKGATIRALVHKPEQVDALKSIGILDVVVGDILNEKDVERAFIGVDTVYHICSAFNPHEVEIGEKMINAALKYRTKHFVYHSVLHSILQDMPHPQKKLKVEELLVNSSIPYTIIQPAVLMQNIFESWNLIKKDGIFLQKFYTSQHTRICMVDLEDVAEAVSIIITEPVFKGATYELCGSENLSLADMKQIIEEFIGHSITVDFLQDDIIIEQLKKHGAGDYQVNTMLKMFQHYNNSGFIGNPSVLIWILGRKPSDLLSFCKRELSIH